MSIISRYRNWAFNKRKKNQLSEWRKKGIIVPDSFLWEDDIRLHLSNPFYDLSGGNLQIGENVKFSKGVIIDCFGGKVTVGNNVFIGPYTVIYGHGDVEIGDDTLIGMGCKIISSNHTIPGNDKLIRLQPDRLGKVFIGNDVWLGADVKVLSGVEIGTGTVIGAGTVVTKKIDTSKIVYSSNVLVLNGRK